MIKSILLILFIFVLILLAVQIFVFEMSKKRMDKVYSISWYENLNKPFQYTRAKRMIVLGAMAYVISSFGEPMDVTWFMYMALFVAMAVVSDAIVLYFTHMYAKKRSVKELDAFNRIKVQLEDENLFLNRDENYIVSEQEFDEKAIYSRYIPNDSHIAFLSVDNGEFVKEFENCASIVYDVEPFGSSLAIEEDIANDKVKVLSLASENRLPFKEDKIDTLICRNVQFDKKEVIRVLKNEGYFIILQNGAFHLKEFLSLYAPIGMKIIWDAHTCANHLRDVNMNIVSEHDYFGTIRFNTVQSLYTYFQDTAPEFCDVEKYKQLYMSAMYEIEKNGCYVLSTHQFMIIARK